MSDYKEELEQAKRDFIAIQELLALTLEQIDEPVIITKERLARGFDADVAVEVTEDLASDCFVIQLVGGQLVGA